MSGEPTKIEGGIPLSPTRYTVGDILHHHHKDPKLECDIEVLYVGDYCYFIRTLHNGHEFAWDMEATHESCTLLTL